MSIFVLMKKLHLSRNLMVAAILLIVAFQCYWLAKLYKDEYSSLKKEVDVTFGKPFTNCRNNVLKKTLYLLEQY